MPSRMDRTPSPCPCKSEECVEWYNKEKAVYEKQNTPTLPHASGISYFRIPENKLVDKDRKEWVTAPTGEQKKTGS